MITSKSNQQMKYVRNLQKKSKLRHEEQVFVVEGIKMCLEAPQEWVAGMYVSDSFLMMPHQKELLREQSYEVVTEEVFLSISDTKSPQGILALIKMPVYSIEHILNKKNLHLLILDSIQDPGNLGTMLRAGEGAGISGVVMNRTTADLFHPKTVRSTMGSIFRVPFYIADDMGHTLRQIKESGVRLYAAHLKGSRKYDQVDYRGSTGLLIGNEGNGLSREIIPFADACIHIPMEGGVESLNAALAAGILMYEVHRQRSQA